jgi:hypothetical protein
MSDNAVQLDYAPPPPGAPRLVARRWLLLALVIVAVWASATWVPSAVVRVRLRWVQNRCATFAYPPDTVVFDSDPAARAVLLADPASNVALDVATIWLAPAVARREPDCWTTLKTDLFAQRQFWPPGPAAPKAMVHSLRNAAGQERLVAIIIAPDVPNQRTPNRFRPDAPGPPPATRPTLGLVSALIRPGAGDVPPRWDGNGTFLRANFDPTRRLRFYAARLDPHNPARFSLRYEMDGQSGTVDGTFQDDGDVAMTVRDGPARPAP